MAENKTQPTIQSVDTYLSSITDRAQRADAAELTEIMEEVTKEKPVLWGSSIVGFGKYHYKYESGREGDTPTVGFSARKQALTLYGVMFYAEYKENLPLIKKLGKYTMGKGCLYIKKLADVDKEVLKQMITNAYKAKTKK